MFSFENVKTLVEWLKAIAYIFTVIWGVFVFIEWNNQRSYYFKFKISHLYNIDYKIAINPHYIISIFTTLFIMIIVRLSCYILSVSIGICVLSLIAFVINTCKCKKMARHIIVLRNEKNKMTTRVRRKLARKIKKIRRSISNACTNAKKEKEKQKLNNTRKKFEGKLIVSDYRKSLQKWESYRFNSNFFICLFCVVSTCLVITNEWVQSFVCCLFPELRDSLSSALRDLGGVRVVVCFLWTVLSAGLVHWMLHLSTVPYIIRQDYIESFRVMVNDKNTYAILAPTSSDNNSVCVAVRTIICKKSNGLVYSYLIPDQVITKKPPFDGESFLLDVDVVTCLPAPDEKPPLLKDADLIKILKNDGVKQYFNYNKNWVPIKSFFSIADKRITIIRNGSYSESTSKKKKSNK